MIIMAGEQAWSNRVLLSNRMAVSIGLISYPLYLWHWPLLTFAKIIEGEAPSVSEKIALIAISILFSFITYQYIEKPVRFGECYKIKIKILAGLMFIICLLGYVIYKMDGISSRIKSNELVDIIENPLPEIDGDDCSKYVEELKGFKQNGGCWLNKDMPPSLVFIGDSHMGQYRNAIWEALESQRVMLIFEYGCLPFVGENYYSNQKCQKLIKLITKYLSESPSVKTVVLSANWALNMSGGLSVQGVNWRHARKLSKVGINETPVFIKTGIDFLSSLRNAKKNVIFMKDTPDFNFNVKKCFSIRPLNFLEKVDKKCSMDYKLFKSRIKEYDIVIDKILSRVPGIVVYDPRPLLCSDELCRASNVNFPYYSDGGHLNKLGAKLIFDDFLFHTQLNGVIR